jgi:hypothetical protein
MKTLQKLKDSKQLPERIRKRIKEAVDEDPAYAADELVELIEEILNQLAALAMNAYISQPEQKEVNNDYILQLFSSHHHQNAGPVYRWSANFIRELKTENVKALHPFFWEADGVTLCKKVNGLSDIRNKVMHGFFLLPPEENEKIAREIEEVLSEMISAKLFETSGNRHFLASHDGLISFSGRWKVYDEEWETLSDTHELGESAKVIRHQLSPEFAQREREWVSGQQAHPSTVSEELINFIKEKEKGAVLQVVHPRAENGAYATYVKLLSELDGIVPIYYRMEDVGVNFTERFLKSYILSELNSQFGGVNPRANDFTTELNKFKKKTAHKLVVVLNDVHTALFHEDYLLKTLDELFNNNIPVIAFGWDHEYVRKRFNMVLDAQVREKGGGDEGTWEKVMHNYLRFKGPSPDNVQEKEDFEKLKEMTSRMLEELSSKGSVIARKFADENNYPSEYVNEVMEILRPFYHYERVDFEMDEVDELYGFPKEIKESSAIFLALGRRDIALEYKHKVLTDGRN